MEHGEEPVDIIPAEKIAFIAYNIGVYESVQKFGALILNGKISNEGSDVSKIAQLLSEANAFYDSEMISQTVINTMVRNYHAIGTKNHTRKPTMRRMWRFLK